MTIHLLRIIDLMYLPITPMSPTGMFVDHKHPIVGEEGQAEDGIWIWAWRNYKEKFNKEREELGKSLRRHMTAYQQSWHRESGRGELNIILL